MAGGPSPSSTSPSIGKHSSYTATPFTSNASSPPNQNPQGLTRGMATEVAPGASHPFNLSSPVGGGRKALDHSASSFGFSQLEHSASNPERDLLPSILIRKLPRNTGIEVLRTMLLFAKDMVDVKFVDAEYADEQGNQSAIARFMSLVGAHEAKEKLHGKALSHEGSLAVELFPNGIAFPVGRRNTLDGNSSNLRSGANSGSSVSPNGLGNGATRQSSRFNGTFQNLERMSPPSGSHGIDTFPAPESNAHIQSLFSPQSPLANSTLSSKSIINDDPSDETGRLLNDPVAFAKNGESQAAQASARRQTNPNIALSRFAGLSLNTNNAHAQSMASPPLSGFASPRSNGVSQSQNTLMSPTGLTSLGSSSFGTNNTSNSSSYPMSPSQYQRHNYPPVNPADQNPPCNTLYVGNLPMDTSEDELKAVFSKQRGYKRLCFRTKQNGPMCFVEFEDISFATKALNDLYGHPLHNSVKGGIRLSFSKNPLGVRNGQAQSALNSPMSPHGGMNGLNGAIGAPPGFAAINGPPPGLAAPPGLAMSGMGVGSPSVNSPMGFGNYGNGGFGGSGYTSPIRQPVSSPMGSNMGGGGGFPGMGGEYANFMSR